MRAITVRQPWAWAIIHAGKDVENRTRNLAGGYRGPVAIHAGLTPDTVAQAHWPLGDLVPSRAWQVRGAVIGVVDLVDVHSASVIDGCGRLEHDCAEHGTCRHHCSPWALGPNPSGGWFHHLVLANAQPLPTPIPARGRLGLWTPDDDLLNQLQEALR